MPPSPLTPDTAGGTPVTRAQVTTRARELAILAGRVAPGVAQIDYLQTERELTGESAADGQGAILDAIPEEKRWDPVPGSPGHQAPTSPSDDEDEEGRSESAQLIEQGVAQAEDDQALEAAKAAARQNR